MINLASEYVASLYLAFCNKMMLLLFTAAPERNGLNADQYPFHVSSDVY